MICFLLVRQCQVSVCFQACVVYFFLSPSPSLGVPLSLTPSLSHSLTLSLSHSLTPSLPHSLTAEHILFVCSGAFHLAKPSDLLAELQGRLPIRVELKPLTQEDMYLILTGTRTHTHTHTHTHKQSTHILARAHTQARTRTHLQTHVQ